MIQPYAALRKAYCQPFAILAFYRGRLTSVSRQRTCPSKRSHTSRFYLKQHQPSGAKLLDLGEWKLFFLPREGVERFLLEAHQHGLLEYYSAGSVTRLTFPVETLEEYANVITQ